jgi:hypothetical protein
VLRIYFQKPLTLKVGDISETKSLLDWINDAITKRNTIENTFKEEGRKKTAEWLMPYSKHVEADFREAAEKEFVKLPKDKRKRT